MRTLSLTELLASLQAQNKIKCTSTVPPRLSGLSKSCKTFYFDLGARTISVYLSKERVFNPDGSEVGGAYYHENKFLWATLSRGKQRARQTLSHELAHVMQDAVNGWPPEQEGSLSCEEQIRLYEKYYYHFDDDYASKNPVEAAAEVFRVLLGFREAYELWAHNPELLVDYGNYWHNVIKKLTPPVFK